LVVNRPLYERSTNQVNRLLYVGPCVFGLFITRRGRLGEKHIGAEVTPYPPFDGGRHRTWLLARRPYHSWPGGRTRYARVRPYLRVVASRSMLSCMFGVEVRRW
jgi:hypothetical protein